MPQLLIVESSSTEALRARLILERAGHKVELAADEHEAIQAAADRKPDLILLGAITPRLNGYATCGKLRLEPRTSSIPVVMTGTREELDGLPSGDALKCLLPKPYDPDGLVAKVKEMLNGHAAPAAEPVGGADVKRLQQELDAAKQTRNMFLANISHELRTPLHEITGMMDLVLGTQLTPEQRGYLDTLQASSNALLSLISDLIEFSELETGQLDIEVKEFAVADLLARVAEVFETRAGDKGLEFSVSAAPDLPKTLKGDAKRLRQILTQIAANAIKFTDCGKVTIRALRGDDSPTSGAAGMASVHFVVQDTGIGIPVERQSVIFEPFQQADISSTRRFGGTGIGLAIAKQLVERLGGRIWVESRPGQGSTFHFTVPITGVVAPPAPATAPAASAPARKTVMQNFRILVAEDSPTNQLIAKMSLTKSGHTITLATNGREAVKAYSESKGNPYDLVLMDVSMPEMDGLEATRLIREQEQATGEHVLVIAMTAFATKEYQLKCIECGMDAYVTKPVRMDELKKVVEPLLVQAAEAAAATSAAPPPPPPAAEPVAPPSTPPASAAAEPPASDVTPPVQLAEALEVVGGDVDILREAAEISLSEIPEQVIALEDGVASANARAVEAKAHRLKGVLGNLGGMQGRSIAQRLETMGESKELAGADQICRALIQEIERVKAFYADPAWEAEARKLQENSDG